MLRWSLEEMHDDDDYGIEWIEERQIWTNGEWMCGWCVTTTPWPDNITMLLLLISFLVVVSRWSGEYISRKIVQKNMFNSKGTSGKRCKKLLLLVGWLDGGLVTWMPLLQCWYQCQLELLLLPQLVQHVGNAASSAVGCWCGWLVLQPPAAVGAAHRHLVVFFFPSVCWLLLLPVLFHSISWFIRLWQWLLAIYIFL